MPTALFLAAWLQTRLGRCSNVHSINKRCLRLPRRHRNTQKPDAFRSPMSPMGEARDHDGVRVVNRVLARIVTQKAVRHTTVVTVRLAYVPSAAMDRES